MSSNDGGIGSTLTGGIQDISAILPLLGTEQCSHHVGSALTRGYLYAAATPMSIFGSLGVVSAGFKTFVACFSFRLPFTNIEVEGATILRNMGFEPQGENLSLIMVEAGKTSKGKDTERYTIYTRMDKLIEELNIDKDRITGVSSGNKSAAWNFMMFTMTVILCTFSIAPYIYLNLHGNSLKKSTTWVFPGLRALGGFITATHIQLLIQRRITILSDQYLQDVKCDTSGEPAGQKKKRQMDALTWLLLFFLFIGIGASVAGYVGCFSVVQSSTSTIGPFTWLALEVLLSLMRLGIWARNPKCDDAPPLEITLELDEYKHTPFPTCNKDDEEILKYKVLPLTRARDFLKIITSYAGLIDPFSNSDLSLYYTLTWKRPPKNINKLGERILYITVFDHKERTTRIYTRVNGEDTFYSTKLDAPTVDVGHFLLEVEIVAKIDPNGDPVAKDKNNRDSLREHHQSILEHIQHRLRNGSGDANKQYIIRNSWTMNVGDNKKDNLEMIVDLGEGIIEQIEESSLICEYFMHSSIDRERRLLDENRVKWITRRMGMVAEETKERFQGKMGVEYRVNEQAVERKPATKSPEEIERMLDREEYYMELLLVYEVKEWEQLFWNKFNDFLVKIGKDRMEEKKRLREEWRANCWKRLNSQMLAAQIRLAKSKDSDRLETLHQQWASSISQFFEMDKNSQSMPLSTFKEWIGYQRDENGIHQRMGKEIEDTKFRLERGIRMEQFDQFWDDDTLFECRYSRSKWLHLRCNPLTTAPLDIYSHALKGNKNITHITYNLDFDSDSGINKFLATIYELTWVTSTSFGRPTDIHRNLLFINSTNDLITLGEEIRLEMKRSSSTYIFTDAGRHDIRSDSDGSGRLENNARVLISFVAPTSGHLKLRLKHSGGGDAPLEVRHTLGSTSIKLNPSPKSSLTIDDITLYHPTQVPGSSDSDHISFEPGIRNDIVIQFSGRKYGHFLHDIDLLNEAGLEYMRHLPLPILSN